MLQRAASNGREISREDFYNIMTKKTFWLVYCLFTTFLQSFSHTYMIDLTIEEKNVFFFSYFISVSKIWNSKFIGTLYLNNITLCSLFISWTSLLSHFLSLSWKMIKSFALNLHPYDRFNWFSYNLKAKCEKGKDLTGNSWEKEIKIFELRKLTVSIFYFK